MCLCACGMWGALTADCCAMWPADLRECQIRRFVDRLSRLIPIPKLKGPRGRARGWSRRAPIGGGLRHAAKMTRGTASATVARTSRPHGAGVRSSFRLISARSSCGVRTLAPLRRNDV